MHLLATSALCFTDMYNWETALVCLIFGTFIAIVAITFALTIREFRLRYIQKRIKA